MRKVPVTELGMPEDSPFDAYVAETDQEWLDFRKQGIGGSDTSAIIGVSKWRTPIETWMEKTGRREVPDLSSKESVEWGTLLEPVIRNKFARSHPELRVFEVNASLVSKDREWAHANLDGVIVDADGNFGILEIKTAGYRSEKDWSDGVPDYYMAQVTHYMGVTGWKYAYVAVLIGGQKYLEFRVERDDEDVEFVAAQVDVFWNECVKGGSMPVILGRQEESRAALALSPKGHGEHHVTGRGAVTEFNNLVWKYLNARDEEANAKSRKDDASAKLKILVGDSNAVTSDIYKVVWSRGVRTTFDKKRLAEEHPEIYDQYAKAIPSDWGLRVTEIGKM